MRNTTNTRPRLNAARGRAARTYRCATRTAYTAALLAMLFYVGLIAFHYQPMVIVSGSMQKTIPVGSLVVDQSVDPRRLEVGDVISFEKPVGHKGIDTHRIVAIENDQGQRLLKTKGDSNPSADPWLLHYDHGTTAHRMVFSVRYAGNALLFARSSPGRILIIGAVCLMILSSILRAIAASATVATTPTRSAKR
jgi:signal peptidase I